VLTSVGLFETSAQAFPNTPKITAGPVIACEAIGAAFANGVAALAQRSAENSSREGFS
jgi:hypothetical protein